MKNSPNGFTMLEVLLAIGLSALFMSASASLMLSGNLGSSRADRLERALWGAQQGVEALQTIAFDDLFLTDTGSLFFNGTLWTLGTNGPENIQGNFSRTILVQDVERDASCHIVPSGGAADPNSLFLTSLVSWTDNAGRVHEVELPILRTRWNAPEGTCFEATMADGFSIDLTSASWFGGRQLRDVFVTNNGVEDAVIDRMTFTWSNSRLIQQVSLDNENVWTNHGPGAPSGEQASGTELDTANAALEHAETSEFDKVQFNGNMVGTTVSFVITFTDGSTISSGSFVPF
jgi:prepilin-type N-terminal cleavage/methylation domain-containing protein